MVQADVFLTIKIILRLTGNFAIIRPENSFFESKKHFFDIRSKKKFLWIEESFFDSKTFSLM